MSASSFFKRLLKEVVHPSENLRVERQARKAVDLCRALLTEQGEFSGASLAQDVLAAYRDLPEPGVSAFFRHLIHEFSPDSNAILGAADAYRDEPSWDRLLALQQVVEPARQELFRRLNVAPGGTAALVAMRRQVLRGLREHPDWRVIDADLAHLFGSWFNRGFLQLSRIDWNTPAIVLEKLIAYEAVHQIQGWQDLHRRLEADRRCFAFFHPALPREPLIFIEVALTRGMSDAVQPLLDVRAPVAEPQKADAAIFYSITNCQDGLRGISFGNLLIKQVVQELQAELPRVGRFATLSPLPGFRNWLEGAAANPHGVARGEAAVQALQHLQTPDWHQRPELAEPLEPLLLQLAAYYLLDVKQDGEPMDAVARFHLGNGARLERLNWLADVSEQGMRRSAGVMVNYEYRLSDVEENHEAFAREHRVIASSDVRRLARAARRHLSAGQDQAPPRKEGKRRRKEAKED
ncbi:MAG: malonyl-CoA decarboxylase [Betaproteobacteria bacterium]|nr:malonyl-CoA decarboxylase [Betaproteobacteria bacterium]